MVLNFIVTQLYAISKLRISVLIIAYTYIDMNTRSEYLDAVYISFVC